VFAEQRYGRHDLRIVRRMQEAFFVSLELETLFDREQDGIPFSVAPPTLGAR
jgi:hypothetical protein